MLAPWVVEEMEGVDLGDKRLDARLGIVLDTLGARPLASIPQACGGGRAEIEAAYRLFDNDRVTFDKILASHYAATRRRVASQPVVVLAHDTTEEDLTRPMQQVEGAGPLADESRRGLFLHPLHAFTPDGTPLGTLHAEIWTRDDGPSLQQRGVTRAKRAATPIEDKESLRWVTAYRRAGEVAAACPETTVICVSDSESDIFEVLTEACHGEHPVHFVLRACQDRALRDSTGNSCGKLWETAEAAEVLFTSTISVRGRKALVACEKRARRQPRESREAEVAIRVATVTLRPPHRPDRKLEPVTLQVVLVREVAPPPGEVPVEWLLLTDLPVTTQKEVEAVLGYYCTRWTIEVLFRVLKTGCRVEERRFEEISRCQNCLAVYVIVAWWTFYACRLGRSCPEISCETIFEPGEWQAVYRVTQKKKPPKRPPPLGEMVRMVASLGGYVARKGDPGPGPQTMWLGLQRARDFALCWQTFGPAKDV